MLPDYHRIRRYPPVWGSCFFGGLLLLTYWYTALYCQFFLLYGPHFFPDLGKGWMESISNSERELVRRRRFLAPPSYDPNLRRVATVGWVLPPSRRSSLWAIVFYMGYLLYWVLGPKTSEPFFFIIVVGWAVLLTGLLKIQPLSFYKLEKPISVNTSKALISFALPSRKIIWGANLTSIVEMNHIIDILLLHFGKFVLPDHSALDKSSGKFQKTNPHLTKPFPHRLFQINHPMGESPSNHCMPTCFNFQYVAKICHPSQTQTSRFESLETLHFRSSILFRPLNLERTIHLLLPPAINP